MARLPRLYFPGCAHHVIHRGNNREACFYDEADYKAYLSFLKEAASKICISSSVKQRRNGPEGLLEQEDDAPIIWRAGGDAFAR
jgi:hypothetical protein